MLETNEPITLELGVPSETEATGPEEIPTPKEIQGKYLEQTELTETERQMVDAFAASFFRAVA